MKATKARLARQEREQRERDQQERFLVEETVYATIGEPANAALMRKLIPERGMARDLKVLGITARAFDLRQAGRHWVDACRQAFYELERGRLPKGTMLLDESLYPPLWVEAA